MSSRSRGLSLGLLLVLAVACRGDTPERGSLDVIRPDTDDASALDGLSGEQLRRRAEALTPEQARERGITDTIAGSATP